MYPFFRSFQNPQRSNTNHPPQRSTEISGTKRPKLHISDSRPVLEAENTRPRPSTNVVKPSKFQRKLSEFSRPLGPLNEIASHRPLPVEKPKKPQLYEQNSRNTFTSSKYFVKNTKQFPKSTEKPTESTISHHHTSKNKGTLEPFDYMLHSASRADIKHFMLDYIYLIEFSMKSYINSEICRHWLCSFANCLIKRH